MKPKTKKLYVIHDNTETGISFYNLVKNSVSSLGVSLIISDLSNYNIDELCDKVSTLENDSIVILDAYSIDAKGLSLPMEKFSNMISSNSSVPIFTTSEILIGNGCIGGSVLSAKFHGADIGTLALKNLRGEDINAISFVEKKSVRSIYDYNVLKKYGLDLATLPPNSIVINKPFSFYETYKLQIYIISSIFIVLIFLIIYLMINIKKRIKIEKILIENNDEISALYEELMASEESLQVNYVELNNKQNEILLSEEKYRLIAESVFMESFEDMSILFSEIRERGIRIALDDFGCGYSSLTYLKHLPMDVLKIDKSFIDDILNDNEKNCIVGLIITLMKQLDFKVIAEGIETKEQLDYIRKYNCDLFQGYLVSKPVTKETFLKLLDT
jgi:hypothetical protein